jgi:SAM-dependent methyltransferase
MCRRGGRRGRTLKQLIRTLLPRETWTALSRTKRRILDVADRWRRQGSDLVPPRHLQFVGSGDYQRVGEIFRDYFIELGGLRPQHRVLDIGCGIGRMAVPLTKYLSAEGSYEGVDIVPEGIAWCSNNISPRFPRFRFSLADVHNKEYRTDGQTAGSDYRFHFRDADFDFVFLTSVFTHMLPSEVENYLSEVSRLLKPGGRCFITWYLLNDEAKRLCRAGRARPSFKHSIDDCLITNPDIPEEAIAHEETRVMAWYRKFGLDEDLAVHYGSWCGRQRFVSQQDICVAAKRA